jgi:hypothetical protein
MQQKAFAQAERTPFTKEILGMIPFSGTGLIADSILSGTLQVDNPIVQLVLNNLKRLENLQEIPASVMIVVTNIALNDKDIYEMFM